MGRPNRHTCPATWSIIAGCPGSLTAVQLTHLLTAHSRAWWWQKGLLVKQSRTTSVLTLTVHSLADLRDGLVLAKGEPMSTQTQHLSCPKCSPTR